MPDFFKYCPQCKSEQINNTPEKFFHCTQCGFVYFHNVATAAALIIEYQHKILFTIRKFDPARGSLDLPGGFVDYHETIEEAIKREIKEEINLDIHDIEYMACFPNQYLYKNINYHTLDFIFITRLDSLDHIQVNDDVEDYILISPHEIKIEDIGLQSIQKAIQHYLTFYRNNYA